MSLSIKTANAQPDGAAYALIGGPLKPTPKPDQEWFTKALSGLRIAHSEDTLWSEWDARCQAIVEGRNVHGG